MRKRLFNQQSEPGSRIAATAQRLSVKARIMMALFALMLIPQGAWAQGAAGNSYNLWIGGTQVTDANKGAILSPDRGDSVKVINSAETWSLEFDSERSALILKNIEIQREIRSGLDNLTIRFEGTNKINSDTQSNDYVAASSAHANSLSTYDPATPANPHSSATLTFQKSGNGSLELDGRDTYSAVKGFASVSYGSGCYLKTDVPTKYSSDDKCYINFANGNAFVDVVTISTDVYYPLWIGTSTTAATQVTTTAITTGVTFTPATETTSSKLSLSGVTLTGKILSALGDLVIEVSGGNTITSPDTGSVIRSANEGKLTIEKASSNASLQLDCPLGSPTHPVIQSFSSLSYPDFALETAYAAKYGSFYDNALYNHEILGLYYPSVTDYSKKAVNSALFTPLIKYDLWVSDEQVTNANYASVLGSTRVSFDATTNTLTLNGPTNLWVSDDYPAIKSGLPNLTVYVASNTSFQFNGNATRAAFEGVNGTETITFATNPASPASLFVSSAQTDIIKNFQTVTYNNGLSLWKKHSRNWGEYRAVIRTSPWTGSGTAGDPYQISTPNDLQKLAEDVNNDFIIDQNFIVTDPLDCRSLSFTSIGQKVSNSLTDSFDGTFDGNGKTISNLTSQFGLFSKVGYNKTATIKNVKLSSCAVTGAGTGAECVGAVVGEMFGSSTIDNCEVTGGTISGNNNASVGFVGGIVGDVRSGTVSNCTVNNVAVSLSDASRGFRQAVGGIVGLLQGTVSGCQVIGTTTISNATFGTNSLYTGAIVGENSGGTLTNNTYEGSVSVTQNALTKGGNDQRGLGNGDDIIPGAMLNGTYKINLSSSTKGAISIESGYYSIASDNSSALALPYSVSNQQTIIKATANTGYDKPSIDVKKHGSADGVTCTPATGAPANVMSVAFDMPSYEVDASATYPINLSNTSRSFTITDPDPIVYNNGTAVDIKEIKTTLNSVDVTLAEGTDYTISGYQDDKGTAITTGAPGDAGSYYVVISGAGDNSGTATIAFTIDQKSATITAPDETVTYNGTAQNYTKATGSGTLVVTYYPTEDDRTNNTNALSGAPTNANTYYVKVSQSDNNYSSTDALATFKIDPLTATLNWTNTTFTYDGTAKVPTATVTNLVGTDACNVTVTGTETNASATAYTATATALSNTNYALPTNVTQSFTIAPVTATLNWTNTMFTYDGTAHVPTATVTNLIGTDACSVTVTGEKTDASASSYTATATALSNTNYALPTSVTKDFTIAPVIATLSWANTSFTYDGNAHAPTATVTNLIGTDACTVTVAGAETDASASLYTATATALSNTNYTLPAAVTQNFTIAPLTASLSWGNTTFVYNGTAQVPTATVTNLVGTDVCNVTVGGAEIAAGSYTATATALSNANYQLPASPTTTFTILDRTATIDFGDRTFKTYYDANETFIVPDGTTAYIVTGVSGNAVTIQKVSYIKAGVPVLLESTPGSTVAKNVSETFTGNLLKYAAAATPATEKHYLLYKNEFVRASGTISNKVYLDLAGYSGGARSLVIGDGATAIEGIVIDEEDGDAKWYDMQGRRINKPTKAGLYIKDGQKVVVKTRY